MKNRKLVLIIIIVLITLMFSSCSSKLLGRVVSSKIDTPLTDEAMDTLFRTIETKDYNSFKDYIKYDMTDEEYYSAMENISDYVEGSLEKYYKVGYHFNISASGNRSTKQENIVYEAITDKNSYYVTFTVISENSDSPYIYSFNINDTASAYISPKVLGVDAAQIWVLIYGIITFAIIIFAVVLAIKSNIRKKILWILGSFIQVGIVITHTPSLSKISYRFITMDMSRYMMYNNQNYSLTLLFPIVAVIFLSLRKKLIKDQIKRESDIQVQENELNMLNMEKCDNPDESNSEITVSESEDIQPS